MQKFIAPIVSVCAFAVCGACAQELPHWYAGGSLGNARMSREIVTNRESTIVNFQSVNSDADLSDLGWKAFAGWRLNRYFGFEAFYTDLGSHKVHTNITAAGNPPSTATFDLTHKISGFGADMIVGSPVATPEFVVFGRVGAFASRLQADASISGNIFFTNGDPSDTHRSKTHNETVFHWGVGGEWNFRRDLAARLEYERFNKIGKPFEVGGTDTTGQADTDLFSLGLLYRF
jgi:OmpA-OmpF porin, OOP family